MGSTRRNSLLVGASCTLLAVVAIGQSHAEGPAVTTREVAAELATASQRYVAAIAAYQCEQRGESWESGTKNLSHRSTVRYRQGPDSGLMEVSGAGQRPGTSRATGLNPRYSFEVRKDPGKAWVLVDYQAVTDPPHEAFPLLGTEAPIGRGLAPYWVGEGDWLPALVAGDVKGVRITAITRAEGGTVRIDYEHPDRHSPGVSHRGQADLDPARWWVVTGWTNERSMNGSVKKTVVRREFSTADDGLPLTSRDQIAVTSSVPGATGREEVIDYTFTKQPADSTEFRLTAYGLPEPQGVMWEKPTPYYVWILLAATGCALLAVLFRRLLRRAVPHVRDSPG